MRASACQGQQRRDDEREVYECEDSGVDAGEKLRRHRQSEEDAIPHPAVCHDAVQQP